MAKERQAISVRAIQDTPPQESLGVSTVPMQDYSPAIQAAVSNTGTWFSPGLFKSLAEVSSDIHDTRRYINNETFKVDLDQQKYEIEEAFLQGDQLLKMDAYNKRNDRQRFYMGQYNDVVNNAYAEGAVDSSLRINKIHDAYTKEIENYNQVSSDEYNPFLAQLLYEDNQAQYDKFSVLGKSQDLKIAMVHAGQSVDTHFNNYLANQLLNWQTRGTQAGYQHDFDNFLSQYIASVGPQMSILGLTQGKTLNGQYNQLAGATMTFMADQAIAKGDITGARASVLDFAEQNSQRVLEVNGKNVEVALDPTLVSNILNHIETAGKSKSALDIEITSKGYEQLVGTDNYYVATTSDQGYQDFSAAFGQLNNAYALTGDSSAYSAMGKVANLYYGSNGVYVKTQGADMVRLLAAKDQSVKAGISKKILELRSILPAIRDGMSLSDIAALQEVSPDGLTTTFFGLPNPSEVPEFEFYLRYLGGDKQKAELGYVLGLIDYLEELNGKPDSELVKMFSSTARSSSAFLTSAFDYYNLVKEDQTGKFAAPSIQSVEALRAAYKQYPTVLSGYNGGKLTSPASVELLDSIVTNTKDKSGIQKNAYFLAHAEAIEGTPAMGMYMSGFSGMKLNAEQKEALSLIQMYMIAGSEKQALGAYLESRDFAPVNAYEIKQAVSDKRIAVGGLKDFDTYVSKFIPLEIAPEYRAVLKQYLATKAMMQVQQNSDKGISQAYDVKKDATAFVENNFSPKGIYLKSTLVQKGGVSIDTLDKILDKSQEQSTKLLTMAGLPTSALSFQIDAENGYLYMLVDGHRVRGQGSSTRVPGTGLYPIAFDLSNPTKIPDERFAKYTSFAAQFTAYAYMLDSIYHDPEAAREFEKYSGISLTSDFMQNVYKMQHALASPDGFQNMVNYLEHPGDTKVLESAPEYLHRTIFNMGSAATYDLALMRAGAAVDPTAMSVYPALTSGKKKSELDLSPEEVKTMTNYLYSESRGTITGFSSNVPTDLHWQLKGIPYASINASYADRGARVTSLTEGEHVAGSRHYTGKAMDVVPSGGMNSIRDKRTGRINMDAYDPIMQNHIALAKHGLIKNVCTGNEEIYDAYKGVKIKNPETGKMEPLVYLFNKNDPKERDLYYSHKNHDHINFREQIADPKTNTLLKGTHYTALGMMANDLAATTNVTRSEAGGLIASHPNGYTPDKWDLERAKAQGIDTKTLMGSEALRYRALGRRYNTVKNAMGSSWGAVAVMNGAHYDISIQGEPTKPWAAQTEKNVSGLRIVTLIEAAKRKGSQVSIQLLPDKGLTLEQTVKKYDKIFKDFSSYGE